MDMVDWKEISGQIEWSAVLICGTATALATVVSNLGTGEWLSGILADLFLTRAAGMGTLVLLLVINLMMAGHYPMPQGVSLAGLCLPVVGALAVNLGLNPAVACLPVRMSTSMLLLVPIDPTCFTTYSGGYLENQGHDVDRHRYHACLRRHQRPLDHGSQRHRSSGLRTVPSPLLRLTIMRE